MSTKLFNAGRLKNYIYEWKKLTNDQEILNIVGGYKLEFVQKPKSMNRTTQCFNIHDSKLIAGEIHKLLDQGIIKEVPDDKSLFLSPIFLVEKSNGGHRMILNLKKLNEHIVYHHFKMETFEHALTLVSRNIFMASIDIENAYYSIPIHPQHQNYLSFKFKNKCYSFTCVPNGLCSGPYIFTRIMKPIITKMRKLGYLNSSFIDDSFLLGKTKRKCIENVTITKQTLKEAGFSINITKSVEDPVQEIKHLGNIINSITMTVRLPYCRIETILNECKKLVKRSYAKIRIVARVIGLLVAALSAVEYGKLHYRELERKKIKALIQVRGNFNKIMPVDQAMKSDLMWWIKNVNIAFRKIERPSVALTLVTDSSSLGWGCVLEDLTINGRWNQSESELHINVLELLAIFFSIKALANIVKNKTISVLTDSSTAVCYVNNMGGTKSTKCDKIARSIWNLCINLNTWIICSHIAGTENAADGPSRRFNDRHEWTLDPKVFDQIVLLWGLPKIDLFASRINRKCELFCSWKPDPEAKHVDAFALNWTMYSYVYIFPPFSLLPRILRKIMTEQIDAIVIAPLWPTQMWFPVLMEMLVDNPIILPPTSSTLRDPCNKPHPLSDKMSLIGARVSGNATKSRAYHRTLPISYSAHGDPRLQNNTNRIYKNGFAIAIAGRLIQFALL